MDDSYKTIEEIAEGYITERKSKFISYAIPVETEDEVKEILEEYRKKYYNARHVCWAYMLGELRDDFRSNDDGEPSGTAGIPILKVLENNNLTNTLAIVIRYFGGIKLGANGLIRAYTKCTANAIKENTLNKLTKGLNININFPYTLLGDFFAN